MLINFPVFEHLRIEGYALFPGPPGTEGLDFPLQPGLSIIAGVNGLGKTTLINVLFRLLTGPFELANFEGSGRFGSTARDKETQWNARRDFFTRRVADRALHARATLTFRLGASRIEVERSLADCSLIRAIIDDVALDVSDRSESELKNRLVRGVGLGSFVDFLTMVKFLTFFNEDRRDILWDDQAQRQFFRILFSSPGLSQEWVKWETEIGRADSSARNASTYASRLGRDIVALEQSLERNAGVSAELAATQRLLDADLSRCAELELRSEELSKALASMARQVERAKLAEDSARRHLEELRYTALGRLFPGLDETARYILTHLFADARCLACGADAKAELARLDNAIQKGICAVCGADPVNQDRPAANGDVTPVHVVEKKMLERAEASLGKARTERAACDHEESELIRQSREVNEEFDRVSRSIDERRLANATLRARLPPEPDEIAEKRRAHAAALESEREYQRQRKVAERKYQIVLSQTEELFRAAAVRVANRFTRFAEAFLEEECALSFRLIEDRPSQSGARFMYPSLKFEMGAPAFETRPLRESPDDVSESQREFVDLAFRMALMEAASNDEASTLVIETPEASLDAIFMEKAGGMLRTFAEGERRVIVTSNLTSSVMLPSMLGGPTDEPHEIVRRWSHVLNLLNVAAPNAAVRRFRARYDSFLEAGVRGKVS